MRRALFTLLALAAVPAPALAQHAFGGAGSYDPAVPTPRAVLGYDIGQRFTPHHLLTRYLARLAAASRRLTVETVAVTFEGREVFVVAATSEDNRVRLAQIRADAARLADPRGAGPAELQAATERTPPVVWLGYTVHGGEASGTEAALALLYQLAAGNDAETRMVLDSLVVLVDPVQNPDGHERHVQDVTRLRGRLGAPPTPGAMVHQGNWPGPRTSHYYFDLNRDWFLLSHPETRGRVAAFHRWWPMVAVDLHEMGSNSTYYFAPPMAPVNKNVPENTRRWWDMFATAIAASFDRHGWSFFRREGYDEFYPGYGISWPLLAGAVGMTFEQASSSGGAIRRTDGTVLTLHDAAWHHYTAAWATLVTTAQRARERVRDFVAFRQSAITDGERGPMRAIVIERDEQGRADTLALRLMENAIEVRRLRAATDVREAYEFGESAARAARLPAGAYVIDLAQPQGRLAKAILEPDAELDSSFIREELESRRTGQPDRFYDLTAWTLPLAYRVRAWWLRAPPGPADAVTLEELTTGAARPAMPAPARYGYAFRPGSEASLRLLAALLADSVRVWFAPRAFTQRGERFAHGALIVRVAANRPDVHDLVRRHQTASGAAVAALASAMADEGTDLGSNTVFPLRPPRVALAGGAPVIGNSFGFTWFALEQRLGYPVTPLSVQGLGGAALDEFDVLVLPSVNAGALDGVLGETGRQRVVQWVRDGGTLVTLDGATSWLASERTGLARLRLRRASCRADSAGGAPLPADVPGAMVRALGDTLSPLLAGVRTDVPVLIFSDRIYNVPRDLRAGEAVVRYAPRARLRLSGYLWPEIPERLAESVYLWTERAGRGRVIGFAGDPNFRDHFRGLLPLFANAVLIGPSM